MNIKYNIYNVFSLKINIQKKIIKKLDNTHIFQVTFTEKKSL